MRLISADDVDRALTFPGLVETLRTAFRIGAIQPVRHHHTIERPDGAASTLLLMPAWTDFNAAGTSDGGHIGVKIVTVSPDNNAIAKPAVMGLYLLLDGRTGEPQALIDGQRLTQWRTAAASALAASYLAREDASELLVVGAGALAPFLARAHSAVRPISGNPRLEPHARQCGEGRRGAAPDRPDGRRQSPISTRRSAGPTSCPAPRYRRNRWSRATLLKPGTHVDLVGGFTPDMREADDDAIAPRPCLSSIPAPARQRRPATSCSRWHPACSTPTASSPTCTNWRAARSRAAERRRDHAVQVGRRRARGSRRGNRGLPAVQGIETAGMHLSGATARLCCAALRPVAEASALSSEAR